MEECDTVRQLLRLDPRSCRALAHDLRTVANQRRDAGCEVRFSPASVGRTLKRLSEGELLELTEDEWVILAVVLLERRKRRARVAERLRKAEQDLCNWCPMNAAGDE